jgi:hypothetical protein
MKVYPDKLDRPMTQTAIERARNLARRAQENSCGPYDNPCTHVSELVSLLFSISERMYPR